MKQQQQGIYKNNTSRNGENERAENQNNQNKIDMENESWFTANCKSLGELGSGLWMSMRVCTFNNIAHLSFIDCCIMRNDESYYIREK